MTILNRPMFMNRGGLMRHDERTIRNVDDEIYRIAPRTHGTGAGRMDAREEYARDLREKAYLRSQMNNMAEGGPAMMPPMPMAQPMPMGQPMLPPEAQVEMTEGAATQQGEQLGQEYLNEMMTGLDTAETTEEVIDAIRGNDKTLQDRYDELANFVGENDASATPESVLAFVQPTIMMTEQGAMDSGIGELMQGIAGEVDMETEEGMAAPMGQGVGELMMAQSVEEVVPQMNQGGYVQNFRLGGEGQAPQFAMLDDLLANRQQPSTADQFSDMVQSRLPVYQDLLGNTQDTKNAMQSKLYFDIAQAGLNLASGVDPRTGESMAGRSLGSQFASAAAPVAASAGAMAGERNALDTRAMAGALQSAEASEAARIGDARSMEAALLAGGINRAGQEDDQLFRTGDREARQGFITGEREGTQEFTAEQEAARQRFLKLEREGGESFIRGEGVSRREHETNLATQRVDLERDLFSDDTTRRINEITQKAGIAIDYLGESTDAQLQLLDDAQLAEYLRDGRMSGYQLEYIKEKRDAEALLLGIRGKEARITQRLDFEGRAGILDSEQINRLELQKRDLEQRQSQFESNLERLKANDAEGFTLSRLQLDQVDLAREAMYGGGDVWLGTNDPTAFDLQMAAQEYGFNFDEERRAIAAMQTEFTNNISSAQLKLAQQAQSDLNAYRNAGISTQQMQMMQDLFQEMQTDYSSIFGSSLKGISQGILTDQKTLDDYGTGSLTYDEGNVVDQAILDLLQTDSRYDPETGTTVTDTVRIPAAVQNALYQRQMNGLPLPDSMPEYGSGAVNAARRLSNDITPNNQPTVAPVDYNAITEEVGARAGPLGTFNPDNELSLFPTELRNFAKKIPQPFRPPGLAEGGDAQFAADKAARQAVNDFLNPSRAAQGVGTQRNPGRIVDESLSFESNSGIPSALKRGVNFAGDQVKDITGLGVGEPFPEVTQAGEQLVAIANMTQRFIRESTTGRPFAVEISQMAEEIARPGAFTGDQRNMTKLQTMRSQLQEIEDIALGVVENPGGYNQKMVLAARQDLTQVAPLLDNYNKLIKSYQIGLGLQDKPDPSMFELGAMR